MSAARPFRAVLILFVLLIGLMLAAPIAAQAATPIAPGENKPGELTAANPTITYSMTVTAPQTATVQVLGLSLGFAPSLNVITPNGSTLQTAVPAPGATIAMGSVAFTTPGIYQLVVGSANGQTGQYVISVQGGAPLPPAVPLVLGQLQAGAVTAQLPVSLFTFTALPTDHAIVVFRAEGPTNVPLAHGPLVQLRDQETNEILGSASTRLIGTSFRVPEGTVSYLLQITHSGAAQTEAFTICLEAENGGLRCPGSQAAAPPTAVVFVPTATPPPPTRIPPVQIPPGAICQVASSVGTAVNVRSGPNTSFAIVTQLRVTDTAAVVGRLPDNSWYQVTLGGISGWISGSVVVAGGQCAIIPFVTLTPTSVSATVIPPASSTPTPTATLTATEPPPPVATLNFSLPPVFGSTALTSGFVPDPFTVGVTAGGPANVSYLGSGCSGFASVAPSFSVNYTSGSFPTLRFYFIGSGDTTMIINSPSGSYFCVDDSFGTLNPTIDFNSPTSGRYDVWIATFAEGGSVGGTLHVTENTGNHP